MLKHCPESFVVTVVLPTIVSCNVPGTLPSGMSGSFVSGTFTVRSADLPSRRNGSNGISPLIGMSRFSMPGIAPSYFFSGESTFKFARALK